jgi:transposase-like protein
MEAKKDIVPFSYKLFNGGLATTRRKNTLMPKKILPSERMAHMIEMKLRTGVADLSSLLVDTATAWIQQALERDRETFLCRPWAQRTKEARGYANGYEPRSMSTAEGTTQVYVPQVRGTQEPFRSTVLELVKNRTESLELLALKMYVGGLSYADIAETFRVDLGLAKMSETVIRGLCKTLGDAYADFSQRDLSGVKLEYLFIDGTYLRVNKTRKTKEAVLVARGYTETGKVILLGLAVGPRESYESWKTFLSGLRDRGLRCPVLVTLDGCAGMIKAVADVYPEAARQRCLFHLRQNLMSVVPVSLEPEIRDRLEDVFNASGYEQALKAGKKLIADYQGTAQAFADKLDKHLEAAIVHYRFPENHWKHIRTSNCIERLFLEVKRRTKVIPAFGKEESCLALCHAVIMELARKKPWRGMRMTDRDRAMLASIRKHLGKYGQEIKTFVDKIAA